MEISVKNGEYHAQGSGESHSFGKNGMNIYRGCQHGCIYCDARSTCYQMNHVFEDIEVKENAPQLLEATLKKTEKMYDWHRGNE